MTPILITQCACNAKLVAESGQRIEYRKCECPWPEIPTSTPPEIRSGEGVDALGKAVRELEALEMQIQEHGRALRCVIQDLVPKLNKIRSQMKSASTVPMSHREDSV